MSHFARIGQSNSQGYHAQVGFAALGEPSRSHKTCRNRDKEGKPVPFSDAEESSRCEQRAGWNQGPEMR